jgi:hypothetical protein
MKSEEFAYALNIDNEGLTAPTSAVGLFFMPSKHIGNQRVIFW